MLTFIQNLSKTEREIIYTCVVLETFDQAQLIDIWSSYEQHTEALQQLHRYNFIQPDDKHPGHFTVTYTNRESLQIVFRQHFAQTCCDVLERLVHVYAKQLTSEESDKGQAEFALFTYLDPLFFFLIDDNQLKRLTSLLSVIAQLPIEQKVHQFAFSYYQAMVACEQSDYAHSEKVFLELSQISDIHPRLQARIANGLGLLYDYTGRYDRAIAAYQKSARHYQSIGDSIGEGKALKNQGIVYHELGQYRQANTLFLQVYEIAKETGDHILEARTLLELGYTEKELGQWESALSYYQSGLEIAKAHHDPDMVARFTNNIGSTLCFTGQWHKSEQCYRQAYEQMLILPQSDLRELADVCHNLGFLAMVINQSAQARKWYETGLIYASQIEDKAAISELKYRLGQLLQIQGDVTSAYLFYQEAIEVVEQILDNLSHDQSRIGVIGTNQHFYQAMVHCCIALGNAPEAFHYVQRAKSRAFIDLLLRSNMESKNFSDQPITVTQIQARLAVDAAIIEFFATGSGGVNNEMLDNIPADAAILRSFLFPPEALFAFVVRKEELQIVEFRISQSLIAQQYFYAHNQRLRGSDPKPNQPLSSLARWHQLDKQLFEPLRPFLKQIDHLFIAPYGILHYLPLHALSATGQIIDNQSTTVSYIASASLLFQGNLLDGQLVREPHNVLAIGVNKDNLDHAEAEALWLASQISGELLIGHMATLANVEKTLVNRTLVHFSCHGKFQRHHPMSSALVLSDGDLTAQHILQSIRLRSELVTLSACDSGLNQIAPGDELMGLSRAFLGAGARALLITLWQVLEIPARLFMEAFYRKWQQGDSKAAALLGAQQYIRTMDVEYLRRQLFIYGVSEALVEEMTDRLVAMNPGKNPLDHPYYWAAFVLIGNPQ